MFDGEFFLNGDPHVVSEFMRTKGIDVGCDERLNIEETVLDAKTSRSKVSWHCG
jgi:hypothetical protein